MISTGLFRRITWMSCLRPEATPTRARAIIPAAGVLFLAGVLLAGAPIEIRPDSTGPAAPADPADAEWYRSNEDFMDLEPLDSGPGEGWALAVQTTTVDGDRRVRREVRFLYLEGDLRGREETVFTISGAPREIRRTRETDAGWEEIFRVSFRYRPDETLRSVERCGPLGCILVRYAPPGLPGLETVQGPDLTMGIRYDSSARPEYVRRERPGEPVEETWYEYEQERLRETRVVRGTEETVRRYADGNLTLEETRRGGLLVDRIRFERDQQGELVRRTRETRTQIEIEQYFPGVDQGVIRERRRDGVLLEQEERLSDDIRVVTRLQSGEIIFRTWVEGDTPVRREVYADGEVVQVEDLRE